MTPEQMVELIDELRKEFDYIFYLTARLESSRDLRMPLQAQRTEHWLSQHLRCLQSVMQTELLALLEANEMKRIDLIVNRLRMDMVKRGDMMKVEDVTDILAVNLIGAVPDDEHIVVSTKPG